MLLRSGNVSKGGNAHIRTNSGINSIDVLVMDIANHITLHTSCDLWVVGYDPITYLDIGA
jgi:hypothetical protein